MFTPWNPFILAMKVQRRNERLHLVSCFLKVNVLNMELDLGWGGRPCMFPQTETRNRVQDAWEVNV